MDRYRITIMPDGTNRCSDWVEDHWGMEFLENEILIDSRDEGPIRCVGYKTKIQVLRKSEYEEGYDRGYSDGYSCAQSQAIQEINRNYSPRQGFWND